MKTPVIAATGACALLAVVTPLSAQLAFQPLPAVTNSELRFELSAPAGQTVRVETSGDLVQWTGLTTFRAAISNRQTNTALPFTPAQFFRARTILETNVVTGDHLATADGEVTIHPVNHASFVMTWKDNIIYVDPVGGAARYRGLPSANLILVTHGHPDHLDAATITAIRAANAIVLAPVAVYQALPATLKTIATVLNNGTSTNVFGMTIDALPAYNLTATHHSRGVGNGYLLTIGGKRIYVTGDTEDIPELRALRDIDLAFVCMNLPYTMSAEKAASAVREFRPRIVYIYHYSNQSNTQLSLFKRLVGTDLPIEVRFRNWY